MTTKSSNATNTPTEKVAKPDRGPVPPSDTARAAGRVKAASVMAERRAAGLSARPTPIEKAAENPKSKVLGIEATCYQCQGEDADPCWQWRVGNCAIKRCGLWPHRPHQRLNAMPTPKALLLQFDNPVVEITR